MIRNTPRVTFGEMFVRHADALAVAGDRFRGEGRVVYEGGKFRVEFEVAPVVHSHTEIAGWVEENAPRWAWLTIRNDRVVLCYREDR